MAVPIPITFTMGALTQGVQQTRQQYADEIAAKLQGFVENIGFQNGGPEPTSDVGPWLKNGNEWVFYNPITGKYDLGVFAAGDIMATGAAVIDESKGWLCCDGRQFDTSTYPNLFTSIQYNYNLEADMASGSPILPDKFRIPDATGGGADGRFLMHRAPTPGSYGDLGTTTLTPTQSPTAPPGVIAVRYDGTVYFLNSMTFTNPIPPNFKARYKIKY